MTKDFNWRIPEAIDLPELIKKRPPKFHIILDHCYSILDTISEKTQYLDLDNVQYVNLSSNILQSLNHDYRKYLDYMIDLSIIEEDKHYIVGIKSKGYKIKEEYISDFVEIPIKSFTLKKKMKSFWQKENKTYTSTTRGYEFLTKWFNDKLQINFSEANKEIKYKQKITTGPAKGTEKKDIQKVGRSLLAIKKLANGEYTYKIDDNIGRFHSNLTNMKKEIRNYLTYNNKQMVNLDIGNSQPLLSGILLNKTFYERGEHFNIYKIPSVITLFDKSNNFNNSISNFNNTISEICNTIMSVESSERLDNRGFQKYLKLIQTGDFYTRLSKILYPSKTVDRDDMKTATLIIFFSDNRGNNRNKTLFARKFPEVYSIFKKLKKHNKRILSHLLQRIESHLVIETIARRIGEEKPLIPIFTIHDSIACPTDKIEYVEAVMKEEIYKILSLNPFIRKEYWELKPYQTA